MAPAGAIAHGVIHFDVSVPPRDTRCKEYSSMRAWSSLIGRRLVPVVLALGASSAAHGQTAAGPAGQAPPVRISMDSAVRLALGHNHQIRSQRLNVEASRADEITAALKPNPSLSFLAQYFPIFSPSQLTWDYFSNNQAYTTSLSYLFERGGKRDKRTFVAQDTTEVTAQTTADSERQLAFQTRQLFIGVLLAQSTLDLARENLQNFSNVVEVNRQRMMLGDLAEGDFYKISIQKLQFETDASSAEVAVLQAKLALRLSVGADALPEDFEVDGALAHAKYVTTLDDVRQAALATRPDLLAAQGGVKLAQDSHALALGIRSRDIVGEIEYERNGPLNAIGFGFSIDLPFHDRNQGNIARSRVVLHQSSESELQARSVVLSDVATAYAAYQANEKILSVFESGYLDQSTQSLQISNYVYQQGSGSLLDLLDAERTNRSTQLAYRQALAAYVTSVEQVNFVAGKSVMK
jgi:cobalt-zinc-cadmium efflux system outer membrane protein